MQRYRRLVVVWTVFLTAMLGGCGFQPRGQTITPDNLPEPLWISGIDMFSPLHRTLSRQLQASGIQLSDSADAAALVLQIQQPSSKRRLFSVDSRNQAAEFELEESFRFALIGADKTTVIAPQRLRTLRILYRPDNQILAREREEQALRADMRDELARRVLRRIAAHY